MHEATYVICRSVIEPLGYQEIRIVARFHPGIAQSWFEPGEPEEFEIVSSVDDLTGTKIELFDSEVHEIHRRIQKSYNDRNRNDFDIDDGIF
jgi:hypothetical protein